MGRAGAGYGPAMSSDTPDIPTSGTIETDGPGDAAARIGQAPTTLDSTDPDRSSRNTAAGTGTSPDADRVQPASDSGVHPEVSIEPKNEGAV
jgi:hypothetical protein